MNLSDEWRNWVEVGVDPLGKPAGGGSGTIMIDLDSKLATYNIMVTEGSDTKNGVRSIEVGSIRIPISVDASSKNKIGDVRSKFTIKVPRFIVQTQYALQHQYLVGTKGLVFISPTAPLRL